MAQGILNTGLELVHKATQHDYSGRFPEACYLYDLSLEYFRKALQSMLTLSQPSYAHLAIEHPETRAQITAKINEYEKRSNQIKQHTNITSNVPNPTPTVPSHTATVPNIILTVPNYLPTNTPQTPSTIPVPSFEPPTQPEPHIQINRPLVVNRVGSSPALTTNRNVPTPSSPNTDKTKIRGSSVDSVMVDKLSISPHHIEHSSNKKANKSDGNLMEKFKSKITHHKRHTEPASLEAAHDTQLELAIQFLQEADKEVDPMKAMAMYKNASHILLQYAKPPQPLEEHSLSSYTALSKSSDNNNHHEEEAKDSHNKMKITIDWKTDEVTFHERAQIYRCTCKGFTFAAKVLRTENVQEVIEAIKKEISIMMRLENEHVVSYLGHDLSKPGEIRLYMEFYTHTLNDIIKDRRNQRRPFTPQQIAQYMFQIAQGLCYLHSNDPPIIHRDLKSENVFVTLDPQRNILCLKIGDFDSSKMLESAKVTYTKHQGTEGFMAPEVCAVKSKGYSEKADIFSFGMVMFEMMMLEKPYADVPLAQKWTVMESGTRPNMSEAARTKYKILLPMWEKCTTLSPSDRPTAKKLMKKLTKVMVAN